VAELIQIVTNLTNQLAVSQAADWSTHKYNVALAKMFGEKFEAYM